MGRRKNIELWILWHLKSCSGLSFYFKKPASFYSPHFRMPTTFCVRAISSHWGQICLGTDVAGWKYQGMNLIWKESSSKNTEEWRINTPVLSPSGGRTPKCVFYTVSPEFPCEIKFYSTNMVFDFIIHPWFATFPSLSHFLASLQFPSSPKETIYTRILVSTSSGWT